MITKFHRTESLQQKHVSHSSGGWSKIMFLETDSLCVHMVEEQGIFLNSVWMICLHMCLCPKTNPKCLGRELSTGDGETWLHHVNCVMHLMMEVRRVKTPPSGHWRSCVALALWTRNWEQTCFLSLALIFIRPAVSRNLTFLLSLDFTPYWRLVILSTWSVC